MSCRLQSRQSATTAKGATTQALLAGAGEGEALLRKAHGGRRKGSALSLRPIPVSLEDPRAGQTAQCA